MQRRLRCAVSILLVSTLIASNTGCYTMQKVAVTAAEPPSPHFEGPIYGVTTPAGEEVPFDEPGEVRVRGVAVADLSRRSTSDAEIATVYGTVDGSPYEVLLSEVEQVWLEQSAFNQKITLVILAAVGGFFALVAIGMSSRDS